VVKQPPPPVPVESPEGVEVGKDGLRDPEENARAAGVHGSQSLAIVGMGEVIKWASQLVDEIALRSEIANRGLTVVGGSRKNLEILLCYLVQKDRHRDLKEREPDFLETRIQECLKTCREEEPTVEKKRTTDPKATGQKKATPSKKGEKPVGKPKTAVKRESAAEVDKASGLRMGTKKWKVYEVFKAGGSLEKAADAALKFLGNPSAADEKSTRASVRSWYKDFERRFKGGKAAPKSPAAKGKTDKKK